MIRTNNLQKIYTTEEVETTALNNINLEVKQGEFVAIMVENKEFRQDLLYRINTVEIDIPPLRERKEDIPLLAEYFLEIFRNKYNKPSLRLNSQAVKKLENYQWPGNVRELQHTIERSVILSDNDVLDATDFLLTPMQSKEYDFQIENFNLDEVEKLIIRKVISKYEGNISKAAKELGLTRTSLYRRMEKYGL